MWYYRLFGEIFGPLSYRDMQLRILDGEVERDTFVRTEGRDWARCGDLLEFQPHLKKHEEQSEAPIEIRSFEPKSEVAIEFFKNALVGIRRNSKLLIAICLVGGWLLYHRSHWHWSEEMPTRFHGRWRVVDHFDREQNPIRSVSFSKRWLSIQFSDESRRHRISRVRITAKANYDSGEVLVRYHQYDWISQYKFTYSSSAKKILFYEEGPKDREGETSWFELGEFVKD